MKKIIAASIDMSVEVCLTLDQSTIEQLAGFYEEVNFFEITPTKLNDLQTVIETLSPDEAINIRLINQYLTEIITELKLSFPSQNELITEGENIKSRLLRFVPIIGGDSSHSEASSGSRGVLEPPRDFEVGSEGGVGDKLYGNQEHRDTMLPALREQFARTQGRDAFTIDEYNERLGIGCAASEGIDWPQAMEFSSFLAQRGFDFQGEKAVRKACKLGLNFTVQHGRKAHFILSDRVLRNMSDVVNKRGEYGRTITSSELRYIFKHRGTLADSVIFYQKGVPKSESSGSAATKCLKKVAPPWEQEEFQAFWTKGE
jgi:hypothetical protein